MLWLVYECHPIAQTANELSTKHSWLRKNFRDTLEAAPTDCSLLPNSSELANEQQQHVSMKKAEISVHKQE